MKAHRANWAKIFFGVLAVFLVISIGVVIPVYAAAPANDDMADATVVGALPFTDSVDTTDATDEAGEPSYDLGCNSNTEKTVWYSYTPASTGEFVVDTIGSDFNTVLHVFIDDGTPTFVDCDDDGGPATKSLRSISGTAGTTYLISIGGSNSATGSLVFNLHQPGPFISCASVDLPAGECTVLENLYADTAGSSWYSSAGWFASDELCTWQGIECSGGHVYFLNLPDNNLSGTWSTDLTPLSNLLYIYLQENSLGGDLTTLFTNLPTTVNILYMYSNSLTGNFPASVLGFTNLEYLFFEGNSLSGDFSTAIGNLPTSLEFLVLAHNDFTGTVPASLASFTNLYYLDFGGNDIGGDLGAWMGYLQPSIETLKFGDNNFNGTIPASISTLPALYHLDARSNLLSGELSAALGNLPLSIGSLYLDNNQFTGEVPASISDLTNLSRFGLSLNDGLVGTIPLSITGLSLYYFRFNDTFLCEPADGSYSTWKATVSNYSPGICGYEIEDLTIIAMTTTPEVPEPGVPFTATVTVRNVGGTASTASAVDLYPDRVPTGCSDPGDNTELFGTIEPGYTLDVPFSIPGTAEGVYDVIAEVDNACAIVEWDEFNNQFGPQEFRISSVLFEDDFETGDFSLWTRFNDGNGYLYPCTAASINGTWGACVDRGTDKRKQLIDETPVDQIVFNVRFNFDINSLSMASRSRFRFMQVKMGADRPFFIVLKRQGGQYLIQLNTLLDDLTKVKTGWYPLSNAPHTIEVNWAAAAGVGTNDGSAALYLDDLLLETLSALDNDTIFVGTFKIGFTSRLDGKPISGIFYLDDIATSNGAHIGLP